MQLSNVIINCLYISGMGIKEKIVCQIKRKSAKCNPERARKCEIPQTLNCSFVSSNDVLTQARLPKKSDEKKRNVCGENLVAKVSKSLFFCCHTQLRNDHVG